MDDLSSLLAHVSLSAGVFYAGGLCGVAKFGDPMAREGHLHLLKQGRITLVDDRGHARELVEPSLLFFPRPTRHRLEAKEADLATIVCANVRYGTGVNNSLANSLPDVLVLPLCDANRLKVLVEWLFEEAFTDTNGRQATINRLVEVLIVQLLRHVIETGVVGRGMLGGLAHPHLSKAIMAMHRDPARQWNIEELASLAAMSRSKFSDTFRETVGKPPGDYLIEWRITVAQDLLKKGKPVGLIANEVGYGNASVLARVFRKKLGLSPKEWLEQTIVAEGVVEETEKTSPPW